MSQGSEPASTPMLLCITPAPAIDRTAFVERIEVDVVLRPNEVQALPGGKGVNAARAAVRLGADVITTGIAGGHAGRWMIEALDAEGLSPRFSTAAAESRTAYVTLDEVGTSVLVYERPAEASMAEYETFLALLTDELLPRCDRAIVAGSIPGGLGDDDFARIVVASRRTQRPLLVDVSGAGLRAALSAHPDVVKVGRVEVIEAGLASAEAEAAKAAITLVDAGARLAIVTDGADAVGAADAETVWRATPPTIEAVNPVGSGDTFDAALSIALARGADIPDALLDGMAAGAANAMTRTAGDLDADVARRLRDHATVSEARR